ncbi:MAG: ABC transporter ATP-binding protein [Gammaproteobacteria bacterium]
MAEPILSADGLCKHFGGITATEDLSLSVERGEVHAIIGPNGAGKTTLIAQLAGMLEPDRGTIWFDGADITRWRTPARARRGLARSFQVTSVLKDFTCLDNVALAIQAHAGHSFKFWCPARRDSALREPALAVLAEFGLDERANVLAGNLAHGEQRYLEIAMALATSPKMLLLDEPMAGMGAEDSARATEYLGTLKEKYTILLVEHDMDAVFALADRITVLVYGRAIASGAPEEIRANEEVRQAYLGEDWPRC